MALDFCDLGPMIGVGRSGGAKNQMPSDIEIIRAIERNLAGMRAFESWTIGLARDPDIRERELDYPPFWRYWEADKPEQAVIAKSYFLHKGMRDDGDHGNAPRAVYLL